MTLPFQPPFQACGERTLPHLFRIDAEAPCQRLTGSQRRGLRCIPLERGKIACCKAALLGQRTLGYACLAPLFRQPCPEIQATTFFSEGILADSNRRKNILTARRLVAILNSKQT